MKKARLNGRTTATTMLLTGSIMALLTGCGTASVKQTEVESQVSEQLTNQLGKKPDKITCPGDLKAEVGTTMRCTRTADDGSTIGLTVKVTATEDDNVKFDVAVDR